MCLYITLCLEPQRLPACPVAFSSARHSAHCFLVTARAGGLVVEASGLLRKQRVANEEKQRKGCLTLWL